MNTKVKKVSVLKRIIQVSLATAIGATALFAFQYTLIGMMH